LAKKKQKEQIAATDATMEITKKSNITCLSTCNIAQTQKTNSTKNLETSSSVAVACWWREGLPRKG